MNHYILRKTPGVEMFDKLKVQPRVEIIIRINS
jgi:hypothetical protein